MIDPVERGRRALALPPEVLEEADVGQLHVGDHPLGLALVYSVGQIALTVWITAGIFMGIPIELEEAALIFGCTRTKAFMRVTLPLALPGLAACAMYAFICSWNETIQAIVLTQANPTFPVVGSSIMKLPVAICGELHCGCSYNA